MPLPMPASWKGIQLDYDELSALPDSSCCVCMSQRALNMILMISAQFHWTRRYFSPTDADIDEDTIDAWASDLENQIMSGLNDCGCGGIPSGAMLQVNAAGVVQISYDGGTTWQDAPQYDPRQNSVIFPLVATGISLATKCAAADNALAWTQNAIQAIVDETFTIGLISQVVALIILEVVSAGALTPLVAGLAGILFQIGGTAVNAAFDSTVWDALKCALYCHFDNSGVFDSLSGFGAQLSDAGVNPTAVLILAGLYDNIGAQGLTNAGRIGISAGDDCGDCGCGCTTVQAYGVLIDGWSRATTTDGFCGNGFMVGHGNGTVTFTIPDRAGRLIAAVQIGVCDAELGGLRESTVSVGGVDSDNSPLPLGNDANKHSWTVSQDSDVIVIDGSATKWLFITSINVFYDCD